MNSPNERIYYLKDYKNPDFAIDNINLTIELNENDAIITNNMNITRLNHNQEANQLVLDGRDQELINVELEDKSIDEYTYKLTAHNLIIPIGNLDKFSVTVISKILPQKNTALTGFYQADDIFLTQCEPNGFSNITYFLDRPDVMTYFTTKVIADKKYPILLSNGDKIGQGDLPNNKHFVTWYDKSKKPSYLFALVIGDLKVLNDNFITMSGKKVDLQIYVPDQDLDKSHYAMKSLKAAMKWDEKIFGREYDLNTYMIVSTPKFNFGAMENKSLNIFNSKYVLASQDASTDINFKAVHDIIGHEYFHNWTGNRITLRNWFQLSLKEGLTVFREQEFGADEFSRPLQRIDNVNLIKTIQFQEDAGPLSHPVRPESYIKMDNFYTSTVYDKGAEVIRMLKTIIGADNFSKGMDLYFKRYDGEAITTDDFINVMEEISKVDLTQFKLWYSQSGTPILDITSSYDKDTYIYKLSIKQSSGDLAIHAKNFPFHIPIKVGLIGCKTGKALIFNYNDENKDEVILNLKKAEQTFEFKNVLEEPIPSLLRDFSAPVKVNYNYTDEELLLLLKYDANEFNRWDAGQKFLIKFILTAIDKYKHNQSIEVPDNLINTIKSILNNENLDPAFIASTITLPSEKQIYDNVHVINTEAIFHSRHSLQKAIGQALQQDCLFTYNKLSDLLKKNQYSVSQSDIAARLLKNTCLHYISAGNIELGNQLSQNQLEEADNLTDRLAALRILANSENDTVYKTAIDSFYAKWKHEDLVVDKWFSVQALSERPDTIKQVKQLMKHPDFNIKAPNKIYALMLVFSSNNNSFHLPDGSGYNLYADFILELDKINPGISSKLAKVFENWKKFESNNKEKMHKVLQKIKDQSNISDNLNEIVSKLLIAV